MSLCWSMQEYDVPMLEYPGGEVRVLRLSGLLMLKHIGREVFHVLDFCRLYIFKMLIVISISMIVINVFFLFLRFLLVRFFWKPEHNKRYQITPSNFKSCWQAMLFSSSSFKFVISSY